jgi:hypothetical protein
VRDLLLSRDAMDVENNLPNQLQRNSKKPNDEHKHKEQKQNHKMRKCAPSE